MTPFKYDKEGRRVYGDYWEIGTDMDENGNSVLIPNPFAWDEDEDESRPDVRDYDNGGGK